ncbi:single-stranded DNA-binding protein [Chthonobacter rhizosphaerae]|uniref:single-stranded DNA-binding protein n=1 Tax=Chthonobacter rhizosphaerae TaxID=2735553 RepID=UPI0015EE44C9|nr:single-stranded DNA-binding protein [Chthonobacter rhizosphaerae]
MSGTINKAFVLGFTGNDPKSRDIGNGDTAVSVSVATKETWQDSAGEKKERTTWHSVVSYNQRINEVFNKHVRKGDLIAVEGQMQTREIDRDGQKQKVTEIVLPKFRGELTLLPRKDREPS